jgi:predicted Zn finger-like uncharacterized protein
MNVTCPQCASVFRVDPAKVPEQGVRARCSVCGGLIGVRRPAVSAPVIPPFDAPNAMAEVAPPAVPAPPPPPPPPVVELPATPMEPIAPSDIVLGAEAPVPIMPPSVPFAALPIDVPAPTPPAPVPSAPPAEVPPPAPSPAGRFANPFLQQDPATRARRLARALVSDLVVYHPEKRQRGLADGTLKELFSEEIRKSWEEYSEQVGEEIASTTPWFTEALNEILAEGRPLFG